jgi:hypothetical protein
MCWCCGDWKCWSFRARNSCKCWLVYAIVPVLWCLFHRIVLLMKILHYVFVVSFISATFRWLRIMRLNHLLLKRSHLQYGKIIDNHKADKKCQRTTSICCDLWTTNETYQKLLWYRIYTIYNPSSSFCKSFLNRVWSKFGFFQIIIVINF